MKHKHHKIILKDGKRIRTNELIILTVEEHANEHKRLYEVGGHWQDKLAYEGLMKMKSKPDIMKEVHRNRKPESYATYGMLGKKQSDHQKSTLSKLTKERWNNYTEAEIRSIANKVRGKKNGMYGKAPSNSIPIKYKGKNYVSISEASRKTGVKNYIIMKEVKNGKVKRLPLG